jgi:hypothetical protein
MTRQPGPTPELSPQDRRLLDALVECNFDPEALEALSPEDQRRVDSLMSLFDLLEDYPVEDADESLVHATLARIDRHEEQAASRMSFNAAVEAEETRGGKRFRMPDLVSVAAVLLIATSIAWPLGSHMHKKSIDSGCASNMRRVAVAFDQYAGDFGGAVPTAQAGMFSSWNPTRHNAVNLDPLLAGGYCDRGDLSCPGHDGPEGTAFSNQWQVEGHDYRWGVARVTLIISDRNPLIDGARSGLWMQPMTISFNHGGRGQNVLATDGTVQWIVEPLYHQNDYIWLPAGVGFLQGEIRQSDPDDVFLAH